VKLEVHFEGFPFCPVEKTTRCRPRPAARTPRPRARPRTLRCTLHTFTSTLECCKLTMVLCTLQQVERSSEKELQAGRAGRGIDRGRVA